MDGRRLSDVRIFRRDSDGLLTRRLSAASATAERGRWTLAEVDTMRLDSGRLERSRAAFVAWSTPLQPSDVAAFFSSAASLSSTTARRSLDFAVPVSQSESLFATRLYRSAAEPLAPILMLLLALPLAYLAPQSKAKWLGLLYAGGGGLLYLVADGLLTVAGQVGYLPAAVGAWAAPVIAALIGLTVLLYSER